MQTKYPIILAHGVFMKPRFFRVFSYIKKQLVKSGFSVYIADTDGVGSIENNAEFLSIQISEILEREKADKINIIAHSKGGLETIYMIENLAMAEKIASVTTICTPYRGSSVANWVNGIPRPLHSLFVFCADAFYKILGDKSPDLRTALNQLNMRSEFDKEDMLRSCGIYWQSYSSRMNSPISDPVLSISYAISRHFERDFSDGMVSNKSARFADYKGDCLEESISHNEIVCYLTRPSKKKKVAGFYLELCNELAKKGF